MNGATLIRGDALDLALADESVDLIITSPPYFALRSYQDGGEHYDGQIGSEATPAAFLAALWAVTDECYRVLKPTGSLWVNLGDKYAGAGGPGGDYNKGGLRDGQPRLGAAEYWSRMSPANTGIMPKSLMGLPWRYALGLTCPGTYRYQVVADPPQWTLRAEVIWNKPNGLPESVTDRVRRSHEQWFHLTKAGRYYAAVDEVREKQVAPAQGGPAKARDNGWGGFTADERHHNPLGKLPGSVWTIASEPLVVPPELGVDHFAAFPTEWPRRIILGWSPSGVCTACGQGRRPVVEKTARRLATRSPDSRAFAAGAHAEGRSGFTADVQWMGSTEAIITGYACACPDTSAPTRLAVVLDPFAGTGTVPMVARTLGRYGIGVDLSHDYLRLARWRVFQSGHGRKAMARTDRERQGALW